MNGEVTRRGFLKLIGVGVADVAISSSRLFADSPPAPLSVGEGTYKFWLFSSCRIPLINRFHHDLGEGLVLPVTLPPYEHARIVRPDDMLDLTFLWKNVTFKTPDTPHGQYYPPPGDIYKGDDASLKITFSPQHRVEKSYDLGFSNWSPVRPIASDPSCLVFKLPKDSPYNHNGPLHNDLATLLNWSRWDMLVAQTALPPDAPDSWPHSPQFPAIKYADFAGLYVTSIEFPWKMYLSPHGGERWRTSPSTFSNTGNIELWHAELTDWIQKDKVWINNPTVRVVSYRRNPNDPNDPDNPDTPGQSDIDNEGGLAPFPGGPDRKCLWYQTSDYGLGASLRHPIFPRAATARPLMLSSQGGYSKLEAHWTTDEVNEFTNIKPVRQDWVQDTDWSRDENVLISYPGYVMPFGHPVTFVHNRKRLFQDKNGDRFAPNIDLYYCEVKQQLLSFTVPEEGVGGLPQLQRGHSFIAVKLLITRTPYLANPGDLEVQLPQSHWMCLASSLPPKRIFKFKIQATDIQGADHFFELPLLWVPVGRAQGDATVAGVWQDAVNTYNSTPDRISDTDPTRTADFGGRRVAYTGRGNASTSPSTRSRDSSLETATLTFGVTPGKISNPTADNPGYPSGWRVDFYPRMHYAAVHLDAAAAFDTGANQLLARMSYHQAYLTNGFGNTDAHGKALNANEWIGRISQDPNASYAPKLNFDTGSSGGTVTPNFSIVSFSRKFGPWGGQSPAQLRPSGLTGPPPPDYDSANAPGTQTFSPSDFFAAGEALLLGAKMLGLDSIVAGVEDTLKEAEKVPKLIAQVLAPLTKELDEFKDFIKHTRDTLNKIDQTTSDFRGQLAGWLDYWVQSNADYLLDLLETAVQQEKRWTRGLIDFVSNNERIYFKEFKSVFDSEIALADAVIIDVTEVLLRSVSASIRDTQELTHLVITALSNKVAGLAGDAQVRVATRLVALLRSSQIIQAVQLANQVPALLDDTWNAIRQSVTTDLTAAMTAAGVPQAQINYYLGLLLKDADVLAEVRTSWKKSTRIINTLENKVTTLCGQMTVPQSQAIQAFLAHYATAPNTDLFTNLNTQLANANKSIEKLKNYVIAQLRINYPQEPNLDDKLTALAAAMDPEIALKQIRLEVRRITDTIDRFRDFPIAKLDPLRKLLGDLSDVLDRPEKLLGEATRIIREVGDVLHDLVSLFSASGPLHATGLDPLQALIDALVQVCQDAVSRGKNAIIAQTDALRLSILGQFDAAVSAHASDQVVTDLRSEIDQGLTDLLGPSSAYQATLTQWQGDINGAIQTLANLTAGPLQDCRKAFNTIMAPVNAFIQKLEELEADVLGVLDQIPKEIAVDMVWNPDLTGNGFFEPSLDGEAANFTLSAHIRKSLTPDQIAQRPEMSINGKLTNFTLHLIPGFPALRVGFDSVSFETVNGHAPTTTATIAKVEFDEALQYMAELAAALSPQSGFYMQLIDRGIETGYRYAVPTTPLGGFILSGLSLNAGLQLWFDGKPMTVLLSVSRKDAPFILSAPPYGGGGFLGITLTPDRVQTIEGSLEFGADILLDIGVADGQASVNAGIYFSISADATKLYGFVHACGHLEIIELINLLVDFHLGLGYESRNGASYAVGEAIVKVEIDMFMFSIEVDLHYRKEMQGSGGSGPPDARITDIEGSRFDFVDRLHGEESDSAYITV